MANFEVNPITGQLDLVGASASYINGVVADPSALPTTAGNPALDSVYLAKAGSGVWLINRRPAGLYCRVANSGNANDWVHLGAFPEVNSSANWELYDGTDPTKELKFDLSGITTGTTRTLTAPNASGRIQVEGQPIGNTTPSTGAFTTLNANNGTLTASAPVLDLSQTWNNAAVTFTGMRIDCTATANSTASSYFSIARSGATHFAIIAANANTPQITMGGAGFATNIRGRTAAGVGINFDGIIGIATTLQFGVSTGTGAGDVVLTRDSAANTLAQVNGTNAQTFRLYNTSANSNVDFERGFMRWSSNVLQIGTEKLGTGSARALQFQTDGTTRVTVDATGQVGIGVAPERPFHIQGSTAFIRVDRQGSFGPALLFTRMATGTTVTSSWLFGPTDQVAGVSNDDFAIIDFGTSVGGTSGTQRLTISKSTGQLTVNGNLNLATKDLVTDTTTGTKIGTGTTQKLGFFNATPIVRPAAIADATDAATTQARLNDLLAAMRSLGLIAT